jgi:hypothetical protein
MWRTTRRSRPGPVGRRLGRGRDLHRDDQRRLRRRVAPPGDHRRERQPGADTINFNIPGAGVHTIVLTTWLPNTTDPVTVDGYTQPGSSPNTLPLAQGTNAF